MEPLRQEDYQAMSVERDRAVRALAEKDAELEKLKRERARRDWKIMVVALLCFTLIRQLTDIVFAAIHVKPLGHVDAADASAVSETPDMSLTRVKSKRETPCYFTRRYLDPSFDRDAKPWDPWYVFVSKCQGCANEAVYTNPAKFNSQIEAWEFMKKWKLETCE